MSITNRFLTADLPSKDQLLLLSYYVEDSCLLNSDIFNTYLDKLDWTAFSMYERHHLMCLITAIGVKKSSSIIVQPYKDIVILSQKPSVNKWINLSQNRLFKQQSVEFKTSMLSMLDTIPNFWNLISNNEMVNKFDNIKEILSLGNDTNISVLGVLLEGPSYYKALNDLSKFKYTSSDIDISDIKF